MEVSDFIAIGAIIVAGLSFLGQRNFNKRNEKLQSYNNEIAENVLELEEKIKEEIKEKGEQKTLDIFTHFFIMHSNGKIKTDLESLKRYKRELHQISKELETVLNESSYLILKKGFPDLNLLPSLLSDFISTLDRKNKIEISTDIFRIFYWGYNTLLEDIDTQNPYFTKEWNEEIKKISNFLKLEIEKLCGFELKKNID